MSGGSGAGGGGGGGGEEGVVEGQCRNNFRLGGGGVRSRIESK